MKSRRASIRFGAAMAAIVALPACAADDPLPPPSYTVKGDTPRTGSNLKPTVVTAGHGIPLNRRYDELTPDEKRRVRNLYEAMPEGDDPPFPADGLGPMYEALYKTAHLDRELGEWTFGVAVGPDGQATDVALLRGDPDEGTRHMATALMLMKYKPGHCAGQPCAMTFPVRFRMRRAL